MTPAAQLVEEPNEAKSGQLSNPASRFATFFRGYGIGLGLVMAAVPVATKASSFLPVFATMKDVLTFSTSLASFLAIAILFSWRRYIGEAVFPNAPGRCISDAQYRRRRAYNSVIPAMLVVFAILALTGYLIAIQDSITSLQGHGGTPPQTIEQLLKDTPFVDVPNNGFLDLAYGVMFVCATMAFVWLGLIEYVQNDLGVTDKDLITTPYSKMESKRFKLPDSKDGSADVFFVCEFNPRAAVPQPLVKGPFCPLHQRPLSYAGRKDSKP